jgi:hypothetical protein
MTVQADIQGIACQGGQCRVAGQGIAGRQAGRKATGDQKVRGEGSAEQAESRAKQCKQAVKAGKGRAGS